MWGCSSCAIVRASRTNRSASEGDGVRPRSTTLTATSRFSAFSRTRNTAANPPWPRRFPTVDSSPRASWRRRRSLEMSSDMGDAKPRNGRHLALGTGAVVLGWLLGVWPPPAWWRDHWPRETALMRSDRRTVGRSDRGGQSDCPTVRRTPLAEISPLLQRMVIIGEDSRFRTHHGVDPAEIGEALGLDRGNGFWGGLAAAWRHRDQLRGASTITQQVAKNFYLSASRNPLRKVKEAAAAALAATLPHPLSSNPTFQPERTLARRDLILARYHGVNVYIPPEEAGDTVLTVPEVIVPPTESLNVQRPALVDTARDSTES